jgi:hypothetical protein
MVIRYKKIWECLIMGANIGPERSRPFFGRRRRRAAFLNKPQMKICLSSLIIILLTTPLAACGGQMATETVLPTIVPTLTPTSVVLPKVTSVILDHSELPRYASLEMTVTLEAVYSNPYDLRQVSLDGLFTAPDGRQMQVPGFWDAEGAWRLRFTPSLEGEWSYALTITDGRGTSLPLDGTFAVTASDLHGWLQVGNWVDPELSSRYLVYQDGTPFYGLGHCDALNILIDGFDINAGVGLFNDMVQAGENYVVWWPFYSNSPFSDRYDDYSLTNMKVIDLVVADAQKKNIFLAFTIWDHPNLRDENHPWGRGNWARNGFSKLGDINSFFTSDEAWAWQENLYRYTIARWGYSPAIGMWQTVSEINGTNAYSQADAWHAQVNAYFVAHDPYRHPTTASRSGGGNDIPWPAGHQVMDMPQVHIYDLLKENPVGAAQVLADWTATMWNEVASPNWVGEFGVTGDSYYPELYHNAIWAALAAGAAMTPAEWNSGGSFGRMTPLMLTDLQRLGQFVAQIPLAKLDPSALQISSRDPQVRGWGVAGAQGGLLWVQDFSQQGKSMADIRAYQGVKSGVELEISGLAAGTYRFTPYDTWHGTWLEPFELTCQQGQPCLVTLPAFHADLAFRIESTK